jgi:hypothetical protein
LPCIYLCKPAYSSYWDHVACLMLVKCYHVNLTSCFKVNTENAPFKSLQKRNFCMPSLLYILGASC